VLRASLFKLIKFLDKRSKTGKIIEVIILNQEKQYKKTNLFTLLFILSVPYLALSLNQHGFLALLPFVRDEFLLSRTQVGLYSTFYFISSALLAIYTGDIVDKLGPRKGILLGIGFMGFIIFLYGFSPSYAVLLVLAFLAGFGWSIITPSVNKGVIMATPRNKRAISMGIMQSGVGLGGLTGASLLPVLGGLLGWRMAIQISSGFALLVWVLVYLLYKEEVEINSANGQDTLYVEQPSFRENILTIIENRRLFQVCVLGLIFGVSSGAVLSHFAVFLSEDLSMSRTAAGLGLGSFQIGGIIGRPFWGMISDRFCQSNRGHILFVIGVIIGIMYLFFGLFNYVLNVNYFVVLVFSFFLGFSAFGWMGVHFVSIGEFAGDAHLGIATGFSLLFLRTGMLIAPPIFGLIADMQEGYMLSWFLFGVLVIMASLVYRIFNHQAYLSHP